MSRKPLWTEDGVDWRLLVQLRPDHVDVVPQYAIQIREGWALTQGRDNDTGRNATDDLILSKFGSMGGSALETRIVTKGGHGDRAYSVDGRLVTKVRGVWAVVRFGSPWSWRGTAAPASCSAKPRAGRSFQGETRLPDGTWVRLYGESIKGGRERDPEHHTAFLDLIVGTRTVATIDLDHVARDAAGLPIGGRYEPEGVTVARVAGVDYLAVGFSVGRLGRTTMNVYGLPLRSLPS